MSLIILFGLPGAGKTSVGCVFQNHFGYHLYDGDVNMPKRMRGAIDKKLVVTDDMRDEFFTNIIAKIRKLKETYPHIVVSQTYIKEIYRENLLREFPEAQFILIQAETKIREKRLAARKNFPLDPDYARRMCLLFDPPQIPYSVIMNNEDGEENIKEQIESILKKSNVIASEPTLS